eukprot:RCo040175
MYSTDRSSALEEEQRILKEYDWNVILYPVGGFAFLFGLFRITTGPTSPRQRPLLFGIRLVVSTLGIAGGHFLANAKMVRELSGLSYSSKMEAWCPSVLSYRRPQNLRGLDEEAPNPYLIRACQRYCREHPGVIPKNPPPPERVPVVVQRPSRILANAAPSVATSSSVGREPQWGGLGWDDATKGKAP